MTYISNTQNIALAELHSAMLDAFSDYVIPMKPDFKRFQLMLEMRQYNPLLSRVIVENNQVLSFWLIGNRGKKAHLIMSGTRVASRGKGHAKMLANETENFLRQNGYKNIQFEVISTNQKAFALYEATGHIAHRRLKCFQFNAPQMPPISPDVEFTSEHFSAIQNVVKKFKDTEPSWQADDDAILAAGNEAQTIIAKDNDVIIGFLSGNETGSIFQLSVARTYRRKNIATALLTHFAQTNGLQKFNYTNIDESDRDTLALMQKLGANQTIEQFEMRKNFA